MRALPLAPCRPQGRLCRARGGDERDRLSTRPCARPASRTVGVVPSRTGKANPTEERAGLRRRGGFGINVMEKKNIDELRGKVLCVSLLEKAGWKLRAMSSSWPRISARVDFQRRYSRSPILLASRRRSRLGNVRRGPSRSRCSRIVGTPASNRGRARQLGGISPKPELFPIT